MITFPFPVTQAAAEEIKHVDYAGIAAAAKSSGATLAGNDKKKIVVLAIDNQNTFCHPGGQLFVEGSPADTVRLSNFVGLNFDHITQIANTLDTHKAHQIFHPAFWVDANGNHPGPFTVISESDVRGGKWKVSPQAAFAITGKPSAYMSVQSYATHYVTELAKAGRYPLLVWPYHAMLGGVGHALTSLWESVCFFHALSRGYDTKFETKGGQLPENYSVFRPEVLTGVGGTAMVQRNTTFFEYMIHFDAIIIAGQAKSHCVAWSIDDLLTEIAAKDKKLVDKLHVLEDCTSSVTGFEKQGNEAFARFAQAGVKMITHTTDVRSLV